MSDPSYELDLNEPIDINTYLWTDDMNEIHESLLDSYLRWGLKCEQRSAKGVDSWEEHYESKR